MKPVVYFEKLDALRFFAFFLVIWQHAFSGIFHQITANGDFQVIIDALTVTGGIGVQIFFVISGFLITYLMIGEEKISGRVNLFFFYLRRVLRIWPLYYLIIILGIFVLPYIDSSFVFSGNTLMNLLFLNNIFSKGTPSNVNITWSVAIEEQFYLFWPLLFILFRNNKKLLSFCCVVLVIQTSIYASENHNGLEVYFSTFGNLKYLMTGCWGAFFYSNYKDRISKSYLLKPSSFYLICFLALFLLASSTLSISYNFLSNWLLVVFYLYLVIYSVDKSTGKSRSVFSFLGKYTYGMYLYHPIILSFAYITVGKLGLDYEKGDLIKLIVAMTTLLATIGLSILSYEFFEKPILKFKNKISAIQTRV
ncbi:MAG TPA: acyltransferase [Bacteroidia bacterium]|jgi:peptidoglycan/LPS O-acetylase OafA/YrhL|nr:acyltransferase [Bacteroidia bacterium]